MIRISFITLSFLMLLTCVNCSQKFNVKPGATQASTEADDDSNPQPTPTPSTNPDAATRWVSQTSHLWATLDTAQAVPATQAGVVMKFDNVIEDPLVEYDKATGQFSPKVSGLYQINAIATVPGTNTASDPQPWVAGDYCWLTIAKSIAGAVAYNKTLMLANLAGTANQCTVSVSTLIPLAKGESVVVSIGSSRPRSTVALSRNLYNSVTLGRISN